MNNPAVIYELMQEAIENNDRANAFKYATMLDKLTGDMFFRRKLIRRIDNKVSDGEYLINIRFPNEFEYIPILNTNRKPRVIKYINELYDECEQLKFRIDELEQNTFINCRIDLDYFEKRYRR